MANEIARVVLTILMYTGVLVFFIPHLSGQASFALTFYIAGAGLAILCGMLRCYLTKEEI